MSKVHSIDRLRLLSARPMRAVFALLAACLILFSLTSETGASAAGRCESPPPATLLHFDGDRDEVPNCPANGAGDHHHSSCSTHELAAPADTFAIQALSPAGKQVAILRDSLPPGLEPASEPKPPRA